MKLELYGPVQLDCVNDYWQVCRGEKVLATFLWKKEAKAFIRERN